MAQLGDKPFTDKANVYNADTTTILAGCPVVLALNGTEDGYAVVKPSTAGASKATTLFYGIADRDIVPGGNGMSILFGWCANAKVVHQTRTATTDAFASAPAVSLGQKLIVNSANDALAVGGGGTSSDYFAGLVACQTLASAQSVSTATSDTRTAINVSLKVFVRAM